MTAEKAGRPRKPGWRGEVTANRIPTRNDEIPLPVRPWSTTPAGVQVISSGATAQWIGAGVMSDPFKAQGKLKLRPTKTQGSFGCAQGKRDKLPRQALDKVRPISTEARTCGAEF